MPNHYALPRKVPLGLTINAVVLWNTTYENAALDEAAKMIPRTVAMFESQEGAAVVELGSSSMERMVGYLAGLRPPCQVLDPPELRQALAEHARQIAAANVSGP